MIMNGDLKIGRFAPFPQTIKTVSFPISCSTVKYCVPGEKNVRIPVTVLHGMGIIDHTKTTGTNKYCKTRASIPSLYTLLYSSTSATVINYSTVLYSTEVSSLQYAYCTYSTAQWQVYTKKNINCMYRLDTKMSQKRTSLASKHFYFRRKLSYFTIFEQTEISMLK